MPASLELTRDQILGYRRSVGALDEKLPWSAASLRRVAWAGLQDSVPRGAQLAIHARIADAGPDAWEDPSLVQLWGPRFSVFVVAAEDQPVFALGTMPDDPKGRERAEETATELRRFLRGRRMTYSEAGHTMGIQPNSLRYSAATGTVLIRWEGAGQPLIWTVPAPSITPEAARAELARRYLHVVGPQTPTAIAWWGGMKPARGRDAFERVRSELVPVTTPLGEAWILASDEAAFRGGGSRHEPAVARLLPSGDPYLMAADRQLLVPDAASRNILWEPSTVWPGGLMIRGELAGTWRRSLAKLTIHAWRSLSAAEREAAEEEASSLRLPGVDSPIRVTWVDEPAPSSRKPRPA
jgi:winged helix DNA-binding protein